MVRNKGLFTKYNFHIKQIFFVSYYRQGSEMKDSKKVGEHFYLILHICMGQCHSRRVNI